MYTRWPASVRSRPTHGFSVRSLVRKAAISDGLKREKNGVKQEMDGYKSKLRPDQIDALAAYIRTLKK